MSDSEHNSQFIIVGRFGRVHGVRGDIRVISFTDPTDNILSYQPWYLQKNTTWQPIKLEHIKHHGDEIIVQLADTHDRETAKTFTNLEIAVTRDTLPEPEEDEYYWNDLLGLTVVQQDGTTLGIIDTYLETGSNDVMVVKDDQNNETLIPYTASVVLSVDLESGIMTVDWEAL